MRPFTNLNELAEYLDRYGIPFRIEETLKDYLDEDEFDLYPEEILNKPVGPHVRIFGNDGDYLRVSEKKDGEWYVRDNGWCEAVDDDYILRWITNNCN